MKTKAIKLYHTPATRSARVKWALHETVGDDFEVEVVDLYRGVQYTPRFLAMNPSHGVPVLEIAWENGETTVMSESAAMVTMLADAFPEKNLAPPANALSPARADYLRMIAFGASPMDMMLWQIRVHEHLLPEGEFDARQSERYRKKFRNEVEPQLLARIGKGGFICGEAFTAADCIIGHNVTWARAYGLCEGDGFGGYLSRLSKREGFRKAFADARTFSAAPPGGRPPVFSG